MNAWWLIGIIVFAGLVRLWSKFRLGELSVSERHALAEAELLRRGGGVLPGEEPYMGTFRMANTEGDIVDIRKGKENWQHLKFSSLILAILGVLALVILVVEHLTASHL